VRESAPLQTAVRLGEASRDGQKKILDLAGKVR
jgi:hypothetical protein